MEIVGGCSALWLEIFFAIDDWTISFEVTKL